MKNFDSLTKNIRRSNALRLDFDVVHAGTSANIYFYDNEGVRKKNPSKYMSSFVPGSGSHIINMVITEVRKRIEEEIYIPINTNSIRNNINTIAFNPENINRILKKPCVAIDINRCYWRTSFLKNVISEKLYKYGSEHPEWKRSCNIAIGALGTMIKTEKYRNGELIEALPSKPRDTNVCRLDIIDHVWDICIGKIRPLLKNDFLMFLTDCFFVTEDKADLIIKQLKKYGYESKRKDIIFTSCNDLGTGTYKVSWDSDLSKKRQNFNKKNII